MSIKTSKVVVSPLRGMDERWHVKPNQAVQIRDMTWNDQDSWEKAGGYAHSVPDKTYSVGEVNQYTENIWVNSGTPAPVSLHWFSQFSGGMQWLVFEDEDGRLKYFNGSLAPAKPYSTMLHVDGKQMDANILDGKTRTILSIPSQGTSFCTFASRLYMVNGRDEPVVFDGDKCSPAGFFNQPGTARPYTHGKNIIPENGVRQQTIGLGYPGSQSAYAYKISYVNERGQESPPSEASASIKFKGHEEDFKTNGWGTKRGVYAVHLNLPIGPVGTVARRIYRTQSIISPLAGGTVLESEGAAIVSNPRDISFTENFYFVAEVQDNVTTVFTDLRNDSSLGSVLIEDDYGKFPRNAQHLAVFKNTMFVSDQNDFQIRYSAPNQPEVFPRLNRIDLSDSTSGAITALYATSNALVVFKERGIYLIKGDPLRGFAGQTLTKDVGCIASRSLRELPGLGLVFVSSQGIHLLKGALENVGTQTQVVKISQPIRKLFRKINMSAAANIRSVLYHRDSEYWLFVPKTGSEDSSLVLKFHYEIGAWSFADNFPCTGAVETEDHRGYLYFTANESATTRGLYVYGKGYTTKGADYSIQPLYETADLSLGQGYDDFRVVRVQARIIGYGTNNLSFNFTTNREMTPAYSTDKTSKQRRPLEDSLYPVYGTSTWNGGTTYIDRRPVPVRYDITTMHKGPIQELRMQFQTSGNRVELINYELEVVAGARKKALTLTEAFGSTGTR